MSEFGSVPAGERKALARRRRSDRGRSRLAPIVEAKLQSLLRAPNAPRISEVHKRLVDFCRRNGERAPSRATVYNAISRIEVPAIERAELPPCVERTLHNVGGGNVPGHQVVFAAFNYGDTRALCYAAGLPWSWLVRASEMRGWRPKSRALLEATLKVRRRSLRM